MPRPAGPGSKSPIGGYNPDALPGWVPFAAIALVVLFLIWLAH